MSPPMIALSGLSKTFETPSGRIAALQSIDLGVERGRILGVIGRSGAGKSTLIRCINLLERPTAGRVRVDGEDLTALDDAGLRRARRGIGMIFQHFNLLASRTVFDNVALPLELAGMPRAAIAGRVLPLLDLVGLADKRRSYPRELSGGQKQRVGIARALASEPKVLLSDEATSALDPETTASILALLRDINRQIDLTILLITHEMAVIRDLAHEVAVLDDGLVVEQGGVADVFARPRHSVTRDFLKGLFNRELPAVLADRLRPAPQPGDLALVRIDFHGPAARSPVISEVARGLNLDLNLLHGQLDRIGDAAFGTLVVGVDPGRLAELDAELRRRALDTEVLGYVPGHA